MREDIMPGRYFGCVSPKKIDSIHVRRWDFDFEMHGCLLVIILTYPAYDMVQSVREVLPTDC